MGILTLAQAPNRGGYSEKGVFLRSDTALQTWVKLSGAYQDTTIGAPTYADATPIVLRVF
jgi:photosystem II stability/assembly factor-like uncharacterized protein